MKINKFKLYLYVCISAFFLILTATLYYSFGYKYDPSTGKSFQTGAIVIKAVPTDAVITKDGEKIQKGGFLSNILTTFVKIENLEPKTYDIKAYKDGYYEWEKHAQIKAGQVEKFETIVLLKKDYTRLPFFTDVTLPDSKKVWISTDQSLIAFYGTVGNYEGLFLLDLESEEQKLVLDKSQLTIMGDLQDVKWTEDNGKIIVKTSESLYLIDLRDSFKAYLINAAASRILNQSPDAPIAVSGKSIIYSQGGFVYLFNYETKQIRLAASGIDNYYVYQGNLYLFKTSKDAGVPALFSLSLGDSLQEESKVGDMGSDYDVKIPFTIQRYGSYTMILANGVLFLSDSDLPAKKINSNVKEARFFHGGQRILYFNDNEIWVYYVEDKISQPVKDKGENELLTRFSGKIGNIYTYSDEEHIFFEESGIMKFAELDGRDNRNIFDVLENPDKQKIFYLRNKSYLCYIASGKIYRIDLKET